MSGEVIGMFNFGKNMKARLVRTGCLSPYTNVSPNFAAVKPKTLKLPKITYLAVLDNVISSILLKTKRNKKLQAAIYA